MERNLIAFCHFFCDVLVLMFLCNVQNVPNGVRNVQDARDATLNMFSCNVNKTFLMLGYGFSLAKSNASLKNYLTMFKMLQMCSCNAQDARGALLWMFSCNVEDVMLTL